MTTAGSRTLLLCGWLAGFFSTGCAISDEHRVLRVWADYNTLKTPALFIEETDHLPYHALRIKHYRWMYNAGNGQQHVGMVVYPAGMVAPAGQTGQRIDKPVPTPAEPKQKLPTMPSTELPSMEPPGLDSVGGKPAPTKPLSKPLPLKRTVPDGPSAVRPGLIRPANL